jgi:hypothetical protein
MLARWRTFRWHQRSGNETTSSGRFLRVLVRLADNTRLDKFLAVMTTRRGFDIGDCADIAGALYALPADRSAALANDLIEAAMETAFPACADLLARIAARDPSIARRAARTLVATLPGDPARGPVSSTWLYRPTVRAAFIVDLFTALGHIDPTLAAVAAGHVLDWPGTYDFDTVLMPSVHILLEAPEAADQAVVRRLRFACLAHLETRIALPLEPPKDWKRDSKLECDCQDCRTLGRYLKDAAQQIWVFPAAQHRRSHVESAIGIARCDVDFTTEKRGSPHRLVCTKNQASYHRRCEQRESDLKERERLGR